MKWLDEMKDGGQVEGLTNKGFKYNGAWGGPAQNGASLPGSVGFSYARKGAPSNGKYAKKTLPSANNGKIIEDDRGQWAHPGKITKINSGNITMHGVYEPLIGVSKQTGEEKLMHPGKNYNFANTKQVTEYPIDKWLDKIK